MWEEYYSNDYVAAAQRFRDQSQRLVDNGVAYDVQRLVLKEKGPMEEELSIDICMLGDSSANKLLLSTSGIHGVEGYPGSAIQLYTMKEIEKNGIPEGVVVAFVHALNPWGMAWLRRVNETNSDLNRNFLSPNEEYLGEPEDYSKVNHLINPSKPPSKSGKIFTMEMLFHILKHGMRRTKQAIAEGQYTRPEALQFGGEGLQQGPKLFLTWLEGVLGDIDNIMAIDLHTGLGKSGQDTLLLNPGYSQDEIEIMKERFGKRIASLDSSSIAYKTRGDLHQGLMTRWPDKDWTCITQEFGTYRQLRVLKALRSENAWTQHGNVEDIYNHWSRYRLLRTFNPRNDGWRGQLLKRGRMLFEEGLLHLLERE
jgi:hypothetical protein